MSLITSNYYVGRTVGGLLMACGIGTIAILTRRELNIGIILGGAFSVVGGVYLWNKSYRDDPTYRKRVLDYLKKYSFVSTVNTWTWDDLVYIVPSEELFKKIVEEVGRGVGLEEVWNKYGEDLLIKCCIANIIPYSFIQEKFVLDMGNHQKALISRLKIYGEWLLKWGALSEEYISLALEEDLPTQAMPFTVLVDHGAEKLYGLRLLSQSFVRTKYFQEIESTGFSHVCVSSKSSLGSWRHRGMWVIEKGIVTPDQVATYFRKELFAFSDVTELFEKYWEWPISKYNTQIGIASHEFKTLQQLHNTYRRAKENYDNMVKAVENESSQIRKLAKEEYERNILKYGLKPEQEMKIVQTKKVTLVEVKSTDINDKLEVARLEKEQKTSTANSNKEKKLACLKANYNDVMSKIQGNWYRFLKNEPMVDVNVAQAASTEILSGGQNVNVYYQQPSPANNYY